MAKASNVQDSFEEKEFEWEVTDFFSNLSTVLTSPVFSFSNVLWSLVLRPKSINEPAFSCLYLQTTNPLKYQVEYDFGLKKLDGNVEHIGKEVSKVGWSNCNAVYFKPSEILLNQKCEKSLNLLTITWKMKRGRSNLHQASALKETKIGELISLDTLSENFKTLFVSKDSCDVILQVKEEEFRAHKAVLIARSPVFAAMFHHDTLEKNTGIINISDCEPDSFEEFLEFLYCGKLKDISFRSAFHLYSTSNKYEIQDLKCFCVEYMEQSLEEDILCDVVQLADTYEDEKLLNSAQNFFNKNISTVVETAEWENLLKSNYRLANKLIKGMASKVKTEA